MKHLLGSLVALGALACSPLNAAILYYTDFSIGPDRMDEALTAFPDVTVASSSADFASKILDGGYTLGIFMVQNHTASTYDDALQALAQFHSTGGKVIYTDWSRNNTYAALFGVQWTTQANNDSLVVTSPSLAAGLGGPVNLANPGWGVFSMGLSGGTSAAYFTGTSESAIALGSSGRTIVNGFLTDTFASGDQGVQLYRNEIESLLADAAPVPEPATFLAGFLLAVPLGAHGIRMMRSRKN